MDLTNHTLHYIIINALGGGHTDTYADVRTKTISKNQTLQPCVPALKKCFSVESNLGPPVLHTS